MNKNETYLRTLKRRAMRREGLTFSERVREAVRTGESTSFVNISVDKSGRELNAEEIKMPRFQ